MVPLQDVLALTANGSIAFVAVLLLAYRCLLYKQDREIRAAVEVLSRERDVLDGRSTDLEALNQQIGVLSTALEEVGKHKLKRYKSRRKAAKSILFVHEIGGCEPGRKLFRFAVQAAGGLSQHQRDRMIFHPDIWHHRNEIHVWATDPSIARMLTSAVFNSGSGMVVSQAEGEETVEAAANEDAPPSVPAAAFEALVIGRAGK
ncbi:hypothetical protein DEW08_21845 (plasmid) [Azospirillum thermophilum]|uniref:Uncharacterized protein n=1 Tax=Azospirillum thermophilum TaxID=2202148 RepID=A0A2S2CW58_9PROT|nr:hypothetical protein DEW08_21845 [Azospirillum thermophilum]